MTKSTNSHDLLIKALKESYVLYSDHGPRSTARLEPLHGFFHSEVSSNLKKTTKSAEFEVHSQVTGGEKTVEGLLYKKRVDVAVTRKNKCVGAISLKFVMTNYKQNANNYFEHLMGETANIRAASIPYSAFTIIPMNPAYLARGSANNAGEVTRREQLSRKDVMKYINLFNAGDAPYRPDPLGLLIIDMTPQKISVADLSTLGLSKSEEDAMNKMSDIRAFVDSFCQSVAN